LEWDSELKGLIGAGASNWGRSEDLGPAPGYTKCLRPATRGLPYRGGTGSDL